MRIEGGGDVPAWAVDAVIVDGAPLDAVELCPVVDGDVLVAGLLTPTQARALAAALVEAAGVAEAA